MEHFIMQNTLIWTMKRENLRFWFVGDNWFERLLSRYRVTSTPRATTHFLEKLSFFSLEKIDEISFFGILYSTITCASCQRATITELITIFSFSTSRGWGGSPATNHQANNGDHGNQGGNYDDHKLGCRWLVPSLWQLWAEGLVIISLQGHQQDTDDV